MSLSDPVDWTTKSDYAPMERMQLLQSQCEWIFSFSEGNTGGHWNWTWTWAWNGTDLDCILQSTTRTRTATVQDNEDRYTSDKALLQVKARDQASEWGAKNRASAMILYRRSRVVVFTAFVQ